MNGVLGNNRIKPINDQCVLELSERSLVRWVKREGKKRIKKDVYMVGGKKEGEKIEGKDERVDKR